MVIGHANDIPCDGVGNAQCAGTGHGQAFQFKVGADGRFKRFVRRTRQDQHVFNAAVCIGLPPKPGVGAAHISQ